MHVYRKEALFRLASRDTHTICTYRQNGCILFAFTSGNLLAGCAGSLYFEFKKPLWKKLTFDIFNAWRKTKDSSIAAY